MSDEIRPEDSASAREGKGSFASERSSTRESESE